MTEKGQDTAYLLVLFPLTLYSELIGNVLSYLFIYE